jgi:DNA polymerase-3 subunit gamma/tau
MPLQHKYRPTTFDEIEGNGKTISALQSKLKSKEMPHAFLLTGPPGCGKTTLGRIIAEELGSYKSINYTELDSAQFNGIATIRSLRDTYNLSPIDAKYRVYLIDEVHRQSGEAQDGMLKMLEDTPPHVIFILCTSEPQKLTAAVKRRCCQVQMEPLSKEEVSKYLKYVIKEEKKKVPDKIVEYISENCNGSIGIALSQLDTIIDLPSSEMSEKMIVTEKTKEQVISLCRLLMKEKFVWKDATLILEGLKEEEPETIRRAILGYCQGFLMKTFNAQAALVMDMFMECKTYDVGRPAIINTIAQIFADK